MSAEPPEPPPGSGGGRPVPPRPDRPRPPAPPPAALIKKEESPLLEYMRQRMEVIERELIKERERALASESMMKQQEALRGEVEGQLKKIGEQLRSEKATRDLSDENSAHKGRVEALERRLDDMHKTWADLLKDAFSRQEDARAQLIPEVRAFTDSMGALREDVRALGAGFHRLEEEAASQKALSREVSALRDDLPLSTKRREDEERGLRDELRAHAARLGEQLVERLAGMDRRLAEELKAHESRLEAMARERAALEDALEEERTRSRSELAKERAALQALFNEQVAGLERSVAALADRQGAASDSLELLHSLSEKVHAILAQPQKAKDQMLQELETEKRDLMAALKSRTEQLRSYSLERREVERSLGEGLMEAHRQVEAERAKVEAERQRAAAFEQGLRALEAQLALSQADVKDREGRAAALSGERDGLLAALAEQAAQVRRQIDDRGEADRAWEARVLELQRRVNEERAAKLASAERAAELED
ncbi:hypothetical protein EPO15_05010, partial [bacterium]